MGTTKEALTLLPTQEPSLNKGKQYDFSSKI